MSVDFYAITAQAAADALTGEWFTGHGVWVNGVNESNANLVEAEPPALYVDTRSVNEFPLHSGVQLVALEFRIVHYARGDNGDAVSFSTLISSMAERLDSVEFKTLLSEGCAPSVRVFAVNRINVEREIDGSLLVAITTFEIICGEISP